MQPDEALPVLRRVADAVEEAVEPLVGTEQTPVGRGAGGDASLPLDKAAEEAAFEVFEEAGDLRLVTEEAGTLEWGDPQAVVYMDPVDGSHNARVGLPAYAVSLAAAPLDGTLGEIRTGLVRNLATGQTYAAEQGEGADLDGTPLRPSDVTEGWTAGFELWPARKVEAGFWDRVNEVLRKARRTRSLGSTAIDLSLVAQGAVDVHVDVRGTGRVLDLTAAYVLLREAGACVTDDRGRSLDDVPLSLSGTTNVVAAGNADLHGEILELIR